jgi:hypothetical protein
MTQKGRGQVGCGLRKKKRGGKQSSENVAQKGFRIFKVIFFLLV